MTKKLIFCFLYCLGLSLSAFGQSEGYGADVTAEQRDQNTPDGWTAVNLPSITIKGEYNITSYGASTSSEDNSTAINDAITAANSAGGGIVIIPAGTWMVANPLDMKSNVVLHLSKNCTLKMQPKGTYPAGKENYLISNRTESSTSNIIIEGEGETSVIDGNGADWWPNYKSSEAADIRPGSIIRIKKGSNHIYRNFKITMAPQTNLTIGMSGNVDNVTVHDIIIKNPAAESDLATADGYSTISHNTDGMPVWANHVNIYNCDINTGDDNIVCDDGANYVHAWNIKAGRGHGMSVGSNTKRVHDIIYENITFNGTTSGFRIKSDATKSGNDQSGTSTNGAVKNIICRNATMTGVRNPIKITSWYDADAEDASTVSTPSTITETTPEFCNILFQNITADATSQTSWKHGAPVYIYGRPELKIHDITLDNVQINSKVRMYLAYCKDVTFKNKCNIQKSGSTTTPYTYEALYNGNYNGTANTTYDDAGTSPVYFNNGDYTYYTTTVLNGQTVSKPSTDPTITGKTFKGWAASKTSTTTVTFPYTINAATTFYAVWEGESGSGSGESGSAGTNISLRFTSADGDITSSATYCNSFSVVGASGKAINIASSNKTIDGVSFSNCAKMGGTGSSDGRYISFPVTGDCAIKVYGCTSSSNNSRSLTIASGSSALGTSLKTDFCTSSSNPVAETYNYSGDATTIYVYSTNSGYNIYGIDVAYSSTSGGGSSSDPETPSSNYPLTATWDFTSGYTNGQYSKQNSSDALTVPSSSVTAGEAQNLTVDVTSGKFNTRGSDVQVNQGTKIRVPITSNSDVVTVKTSAGYNANYTIGGTVMTAQEVSHIATNTEATQGYVEIEAIGSGYLHKISVVQNNQTITKGNKTVTYYDYNGTTSLGTQTVTEGDGVGEFAKTTCTLPSGYTFGGWYTATGLAFTTTSSVIEDMPVYPYIYKVENGYYMVPAGCGKVLLYTLKNVSSGSKVFLPNGTYDFGTAVLNSVAANISVIGQSQDKVIIRNAPTEEGIGATATLMPGGNDYMQDLSIQCSSESCATPDASRCVTIQDKTTRNVFKNVSLLSGQDTYYSNGSVSQQSYFENCYITGTVDYICGGGDIVFKNTTFYNLERTNGDVIFAPATNSSTKWGYVALDCTVDGASGQNTKFNIGRDWQGSPAATLINTEFKILPTTAAYSKMSDKALTLRFHEYNSHQSDGTVITGHNLNALLGTNDGDLYLSESAAANYNLNKIFASGQYDNVDAWDPTALTNQATVSDVTYANGSLSWTGSAPAYLIEDASGNFVAITTTTSYTGGAVGYTVRAANSKGGFGEAVAAEEDKPAKLAFTASVQGGSRPSGSYIDAETHLYNNWGASGWVAQTYLGFTVAVPEGKQISSATLKFTSKVDGGSAQSYTATANLLSKTQTNSFDENNVSLSNALGTSVGSWTDYRTAYNHVSLTIAKDALNDVITSGTTSKVIFQLGGSSGGATVYGKGSSNAPSLEVEFEDKQSTSSTFSYTISSQDNTAGTYTATGGSVTIGSASKVEEQSNENGFKFDGDSGSKYIKCTLSRTLAAGDIITLRMLSSNSPSGSDYGVSVGTTEFTAVETAFLSSGTKNVWENVDITIPNNSDLIGKSEIYLFRASGKSTYLAAINMTLSGTTPASPTELAGEVLGDVPVITGTAGTAVEFEAGKRYSKLLIDSRLNNFYANTTKVGLATYDTNGQISDNRVDGKTVLDYVPGLVAKAVIEAADYYKDYKDGKRWYLSVENYANAMDISSNGKAGKSFDDLNAVKLYFKLKEMAASYSFANSSTVTTANARFASTLTAFGTANKDYVIKSTTNEKAAGGWWHKATYENEMWCDGQYMGPALLAQMINEYGSYSKVNTEDGKNDWDLITKQFNISWNYLWNDSKKLLYHAFSAVPNNDSYWATVTAPYDNTCSTNSAYWGRADGWYFFALVDVLEQMDKAGIAKDNANYVSLKTKLNTLADGLAARQDAATGLWYQVLDESDGAISGNYLESSASAIFIAAYLKGQRLGYFNKDYSIIATKAYKGFINKFLVSDGNGGVHIWGSSRSAGLSSDRKGDNNYYINGSDAKMVTIADKLTEGKVLGAFIMAATEYERAFIDATPVNVSSACYATFYDSQHAYTMPENVEGYVWNNGLKKEYEAGDVVPADVALVLKATQGNYTLSFTNSTAKVLTQANALLGTDTDTDLVDDGSYFYALSLNAAGDANSVGFYWMNSTGSAFKNGAHKAYLKLAKGSGTPIMAFPFNDDATGVSEFKVQSSKLKDGKFIENGKIVIVKNGVKYNVAGQVIK